MAANPITYAEVQAFMAETYAALGAWDVALIMRLDTTILEALRRESKEDKSGAETEVSVNDRKGVRGLLSGIRDRMAGRGK